MAKYLLSTLAVEGDVAGSPGSPEKIQKFMERVIALEAEMEEKGSFVFGGQLGGPDASTVIRPGDPELMMTDGPFVESKEHIAGFYIINADDLDDALDWTRKVRGSGASPDRGSSVRSNGKVADHMGEMDS